MLVYCGGGGGGALVAACSGRRGLQHTGSQPRVRRLGGATVGVRWGGVEMSVYGGEGGALEGAAYPPPDTVLKQHHTAPCPSPAQP